MKCASLKLATLSVALPTALVLVSCNMFDPIDGPGEDNDQLLSAARACFDNGDYECAAEYYGQITPKSDQVKTELVFLALDPLGASIGSFMKALGTSAGSPGDMVTSVSNSIGLKSPGEETRKTIYNSYKANEEIGTTEQQGLVRFISAMSMVSAVLAEEADTPGDLRKSDLVADVQGCLLAGNPGCVGSADCDPPVGAKVSDSASFGDMDTATVANFTGSPTLAMVRAAVAEVQPALVQMGAASQDSAAFADAVVTAFDLSPRCARRYLIENGAGRD